MKKICYIGPPLDFKNIFKKLMNVVAALVHFQNVFGALSAMFVTGNLICVGSNVIEHFSAVIYGFS